MTTRPARRRRTRDAESPPPQPDIRQESLDLLVSVDRLIAAADVAREARDRLIAKSHNKQHGEAAQ